MSPGAVLLVVDLEGIPGVDTIPSLIAGTPAYERARERLTDDVNQVVQGLLAAGYSAVRVSDSHRSGSGGPNVRAGALHPAASLAFLPDAYALELFRDVAAVACVGMHAPGGGDGFAAHTVDPLAIWRSGERVLSEADIVLGLAAEVGVPALFVTGDDVLGAQLDGRVGYVVAKRADGIASAESGPAAAVYSALAPLMSAAPRPQPPPTTRPLTLTFKSRAQATLAAAAGAVRAGDYAVVVADGSFRSRYERARGACLAAGGALAGALRGAPGDAAFCEDVEALMVLPWPSTAQARAPVAEAGRALRAFLKLTAAADARSRALRGLTLHMLQGHAPAFFERHALAPALDAAVDALGELPIETPLGLDKDQAMARVDAWYVRRRRGLPHPSPDAAAFRAYLRHLQHQGEPLYAWLLGELGRAGGLQEAAVAYPAGELAEAHARVLDLYGLTHLILLDTDYLHSPLDAPDAASWTERCLLATPYVLQHGLLDLAGELAIGLQCAGEARGGAHEALIARLAHTLAPDGSLRELDDVAGNPHATAVALLALAGAVERDARPAVAR